MILNDELKEFECSVFTGVTVGMGSLVLLFSSGARVMIQCSFQCEKNNHIQEGHGENIESSNLLFAFLNHKVESCTLSDSEVLDLSFGKEGYIRVIPECNGFESYVMTTSKGDYPVIMY